MRKIFSLCILILTLCLGSTVFAAKTWSESEFEEYMKYLGYGDFDLSEFTYTNCKQSGLINSLQSVDNSTVILRANSGTNSGFSNTKFLYIPIYRASCYFRETSEGNHYLHNGTHCLQVYLIDTVSKTCEYINDYPLIQTSISPYTWRKSNHDVTEEEWASREFKTMLFEGACLFSELPVSPTEYYFQGGRIVNTSVDDVVYKGSISYLNSLNTLNVSFEQGFDSELEYDLILERYQLSENYDYGISEYPLESINLGKIKTTDTSFNVELSNLALGSNNAYRLCLGFDNFDSLGINIVLLSTDWLLPNTNTLWRFRTFARCHYVQLLSLVSYSPNYEDPTPEPDIGGESSGDSNSTVSSLNYPEVIEYPLGLWDGESLIYKVFYEFQEFNVEISYCWMHFDKYEIVNGDLIYIGSLKFNPFINENYNYETFMYQFDALNYDSDDFFDSNGVYIYIPYLRSNWGLGLYPEYSYKCTFFYTPLALSGIVGENPDDYFDDDSDFDYPQFDSNTSNLNDLINDTTTWVTNIFGFLYLFPPWFVSCIIGAITVVVICRILGR